MGKGLVGLGLAAMVGAGAAAAAQEAPPEPDIGRIEFMASCAQCHGSEGRGDGIMAQFLTVPPPDLTRIQRDNDGVFPAATLYEIIEGGTAASVHGTREMPAWGDRFSVQAHLLLGWPLEPEDRDAFIRSRILALIDHIARMQEE